MQSIVDHLLAWYAVPENGLLSVALIAFISATLLPMGSAPAVFGFVKLNPDQFWLVENEFIYFDHPESGYLKFLTELGATGFVCIFLFVLLPMFNAFLVYLRTKDSSIILLISAVLSWMTGFYSTYSFGDVRLKILIITILCLLILSKRRLLQPDTPVEDAEPIPQ
jgi:hypothetical protein